MSDNQVRRESLKGLRKATNALRRRVERERKRQETIIALYKDALKLGEELSQIRAEENKLFSRALDEHRNPPPYRDDGRYPL